MNGSLAERGWTVTAPDLLVSPPTGEFDLVSLQYPALAIGRRNDVIRALTSARSRRADAAGRPRRP